MFYGRAGGDYGKGGTPPKRNDRYEQMTKQQELIEQKKREIRAKLEAEKQRKEMELLMKKSGSSASNKSAVVGRGVSSSTSSSNKQSSSIPSEDDDNGSSGKKAGDVQDKKNPAVPFANDGSFLEQFKRMQAEQQRKKEEEEAKKAAATSKIKEEPEENEYGSSSSGASTTTAKLPKPTIKILNAPVRSSSPADSNSSSNPSQPSGSSGTGSRNSMSSVPPPSFYNQSNQFAPPTAATARTPPPPAPSSVPVAPMKVDSSGSGLNEYGSHAQDRYYPRSDNPNQGHGHSLQPINPPPPPPPPPPQPPGHSQHPGGFPSQVVRQLAQQVAEFGDHIEKMARVENQDDPLMWFLFRPDSAEYGRYRDLVSQYQRDMNPNQNQNNFRERDAMPSSEYGSVGGGSSRLEPASSSASKRGNNSSSSEEESEYGGGERERERDRDRRRSRKRRSRWGPEGDSNSAPSPPPGTFDLAGPRGPPSHPHTQSQSPPLGFNHDQQQQQQQHPNMFNFRPNNPLPPPPGPPGPGPHGFSNNANLTPLGSGPPPRPPGFNTNNPNNANNQPLGPPGVSDYDYNSSGQQGQRPRMLPLPQGVRPPGPPGPGNMGSNMGMGGGPHGMPPHPPGMSMPMGGGGNFPPNQFRMGGPPPPLPPPPGVPGQGNSNAMQQQQQPWGMGIKEEMSMPSIPGMPGSMPGMQGLSSNLNLGMGVDRKPMAVVPPATLGSFPLLQNFNPNSKEQPSLHKVTRHSPQLLAYAQQAYGTTNLDEEQWKQCEEAYKMNLVFQDIARKKAKDKTLEAAGKFKHEYDSDEDVDDGGTWEHKQRMKEMEKTRDWATDLTSKAKGKHHIGDFLPPAELAKFMEKYKAVKEGRELDSSDYQEFKIAESNVGFKMLQKMGWSDGQGLGSTGQGIIAPIEKGNAVSDKQGLGQEKPGDLTEEDDEYTAYRKRMMLAYRFRPNPLNNPRRAYY